MTLKKIMEVVDDKEVPCLKFRLKNEEKVITYEAIGSFLGLKSNAPSNEAQRTKPTR